MTDPDFLSGEGGTVSRPLRAEALDRLLDLGLLPTRRALRAAAALAPPPRRVLALGVVRPELPGLMTETRAELAASRHHVQLHTAEAGDRGKFPNLNHLLAAHPPEGFDWILVVDDDVRLPAGFLDTFLFLAEALGLQIAQPAHRRRSHASWPVTRRRPRALARRTSFVEIGPITAFAAPTFGVLLPFPELRWGWGLDAHWAAIAAREGWPVGVIDATPVRHGLRPVGSTYSSTEAVREAERFLAERPYLPARDAARTLSTITQVPGLHQVPTSMSDPADSPIRVMVIDDQHDVRFLIGAIVQGAGDIVVVAEVGSGDEALARIAELDPDVVILDAIMPVKDGLATAGEILARRPDQPILLCSASADPRVWERAREGGVAACVSKDDFFSIPEVVRNLAGRH